MPWLRHIRRARLWIHNIAVRHDCAAAGRSVGGLTTIERVDRCISMWIGNALNRHVSEPCAVSERWEPFALVARRAVPLRSGVEPGTHRTSAGSTAREFANVFESSNISYANGILGRVPGGGV
jgi:hypothetical protein